MRTRRIFGRTTYPPDPSLDGSRLSCYCLRSNKTREQGDWDCNIVMVMLTEYGKPEMIANLLRKSDLWRFVDPDLKIWIKTPTLYEKVTSNLTNLHFARERIVSCAGYHIFIVGRWGGPASPALLESCDKQLLSSACLGLAGEEDRRNATSFTCSRSTRQLLSHSRRGWAGSLAVWLCPDTWFASSAWDLIWVV